MVFGVKRSFKKGWPGGDQGWISLEPFSFSDPNPVFIFIHSLNI